jgi:hypothetical protein
MRIGLLQETVLGFAFGRWLASSYAVMVEPEKPIHGHDQQYAWAAQDTKLVSQQTMLCLLMVASWCRGRAGGARN